MPAFTPPTGKSCRRTRSAAPETNDWSARCEQAVDAGIAVSIFVIPLMLGGTKPTAQLSLVVLSVLTASAWLLAQAGAPSPRWRWLGAEPLILAAAALLALQITPLPQDWLDRIAPAWNRLLPLWSATAGDAQLGDWTTISVAPAASRSGLVTFGACALLFLVTAQRIRSFDDARRVLNWVALAAAGQAFLGLAQFFFGNGKFFWVHIEPGISTAGEVHGSFLNRNHAADFLALGIGPLLRIAFGDAGPGSSKEKRASFPSRTDAAPLLRTAAWIGVAGVVLACALTMSRGGLLALGAATVVFVVVSQGRSASTAGVLPIVAILAGGVAAAMFLPGAERIEQRLASLTSLDFDQLDQDHARRRIWDAAAGGIAEFPILGTGPGSLRFIYPIYFPYRDEQLAYTTADNGYIELALENGLTGLLLAVAALALLISRSVRAAALSDSASGGCAAAVLAGISASAVHALCQSSWFVPGCAVQLIPLAACAVTLCRLEVRSIGQAGFAMPRPLCGLAVLALPCCLIAALPVKQDLLRNAACNRVLDPLTTDAREFDPAAMNVDDWRGQLDFVSRNAAGDPRVHLALAGQYLQLFEQLQKTSANPLTLLEIRETVSAGAFQSSDEVREWLSRAFEDNSDCLFAARDHARRSVELCPLEGRAYVYLSELAFLDLKSIDARRRLLDQAARVRPYDAHVMFAAGQLEFQSGNLAGTLEHWKRAYHQSPVWQPKITDALIHILPAEEFLATFQPDWTALRELRHRLRGTSHPGYPLILQRLADATAARAQDATSAEAAVLWLEAWQEFDELHDVQRALDCALAAVSADPGSYEAHLKAGRALLDNGRRQEALDPLRWCRRRKADDQQVAELLVQAMQSQLDAAPASDVSQSNTANSPMHDPAVQTAGIHTQESSAGLTGWINDRAAVTQADYIGPPPRKD